MTFLKRYRSTGADVPFGHPTRAHRGVSMEGYFWRITDPKTGRVIIALCGANMGPQGAWATIGLAAWPAGFVRTAALDGAWTDPHSLGVRGGTHGRSDSPAFEGDAQILRLDLGERGPLMTPKSMGRKTGAARDFLSLGGGARLRGLKSPKRA